MKGSMNQACFRQLAKKPGLHDESLRQKPVRLPDHLYVLAVSSTLKELCSQINGSIAKNEKEGHGKIRFIRSSLPISHYSGVEAVDDD